MEQAEEVQAKVDARLARAELFVNGRRPVVWIILHESVLHQQILPAAGMAEQLNHVAKLAQRRQLVPQVMPWNVGAHPLMLGAAKVMTFTDAPPLAYTESPYSGATIDDPPIVKKYSYAYDVVRAAALSPQASVAMIQQAAEDHRNGNQPGYFERPPLA
ncbi:DUF5753 domain-containing protein [Streptomyces sp. NBC_01795]|uniref:DUF5753 domain-containing protein n=1 Tax=Streptomyces sp. NBC_01795 TaxID=2975943 RepID=UPI002DDBA980|nr:DUF5753 domain-containing protein [Streptomyces sp. NBC_01795]